MAVYVKTVLDYHDAMNQYSQWVLQDKLVFAVNIKHECPEYSEFLRLIVNVDPIYKVILFNQNSYYAVRELCPMYSSVMGPFLMLYCPCCFKEFNTPPTC